MRSDIQPGSTFPDYELPDHENVTRKLSELQGDDPLILAAPRSGAQRRAVRSPQMRSRRAPRRSSRS